jgi:segregation and condensation protein A
VTEISIASLADQFLAYLSGTPDINLDDVTDFLMVATVLLRLKTRLLLPYHPQSESDGEDDENPGEQLVERLWQYRRYKLAGQKLGARQTGVLERIFYRRPEEAGDEGFVYGRPDRLKHAWERLQRLSGRWRSVLRPWQEVKVTHKMRDALQYLHSHGGSASFAYMAAALSRSRPDIAALFLGLLELVKDQAIILQQEAYDGDMMITLRR